MVVFAPIHVRLPPSYRRRHVGRMTHHKYQNAKFIFATVSRYKWYMPLKRKFMDPNDPTKINDLCYAVNSPAKLMEIQYKTGLEYDADHVWHQPQRYQRYHKKAWTEYGRKFTSWLAEHPTKSITNHDFRAFKYAREDVMDPQILYNIELWRKRYRVVMADRCIKMHNNGTKVLKPVALAHYKKTLANYDVCNITEYY